MAALGRLRSNLTLLEGIAGQDLLRHLQDQFIDPVKACLASRLGRPTQNSSRLRLTQNASSFHVPQSNEPIELTSPQQDAGRLKAYVHRYYDNANPSVQVEIDPKLLLIRQIRLPLVAKRNLVNVVGYEIDRFSPFEADDVYFHFTPQEQNEKGGWLEGCLIVAQKKRLDPWYQLLSEVGVQVEKVTLLGEVQPLNLKPRQAGNSHPRGNPTLYLWMSVAALLVVALGSAVWQQRRIAIDLERKMQTAHLGATQSMQIEEKLAQRREAVGMVSAQRKGYLSMSELLLELTRLIPSNGWLQRISLSADNLVVTGMADQASELIALLEGSPLFESVRFQSPVVRDRRSGKEKFDLSMKLSRESQQ